MNHNYQAGHDPNNDEIGAMVSVQPSALLSEGPFGYALHHFQQQTFFPPDPPPEPMPEPAPGHAILSDSDNRSLDALWKVIEYNTPQPNVEEGLNFTNDWLPPQYVGSTTSFGVPITPGQTESPGDGYQNPFHGGLMASTSSTMPPPPPPLQHAPASFDQHPTADVLAAAHMLQNGSMSQQFGGTSAFPLATQGSHMGHFQDPLPTRSAWPDHQQQPQNMLPTEEGDDLEKTFVNMYAGQQGLRPPRPRAIQPIRWGTDESFTQGRFIPPNPKETSEAMEQERQLVLECLEPNKSAANTRPSSPIQGGLPSPLRLKTREAQPQARDDMDAPAAKRRKSKAKEEPEDDTPKSAGLLKSKPDMRFTQYDSASPPAAGSSAKRRKSSGKGAGSSKTPRENLTEDQKRENHIKSEQKRREIIKKGFEDLCDLVPEAKGGQFSKSAILVMTADWLEQMLQGNEILRAQARSMGLDPDASDPSAK
ncbi:hypothetical protein DL546_004824 [Coniochaeta pulveracea]|uniref:BHLH domain-containing protein n=1 Tax=Coniochaeta pulveracea TaxID=177199 RepID=A0A420Y7K6_9PEZI|nr:hypothetical protein DL546_004824 [Coniochaeta pulveracea]